MWFLITYGEIQLRIIDFKTWTYYMYHEVAPYNRSKIGST